MHGAAAMNRELMEQIALAGGGKFYTPEKADLLVKDLKNNQQVHSVAFTLDIWNIPIVFFSLLLFFALEWLLRRRTGLS